MKIIDWYILKKYFSSVIFTLVLFSVIAVAIDASEKTDDFVKSGLTTFFIIKNYYVGFIPFILSMIFPLMVFIAVIFFTSKMAGRSEIIAIIAGGIPYNRFLRPYLIGSIFLSAIFWYSSQYLIPRANYLRGSFQARYIDNNSSYYAGQDPKSSFYLQSAPNTFFGMRGYDTLNKSANNFFLQRTSSNKIVYNLRAENIRWDTSKKNWRLDNAIERKINGLKEEVKIIPTLNIDLKVKPEELRRDRYLKDRLETPDLLKFIKQQQARGTEGLNELMIEHYKRDATPVSVVILTMIGSIIASRKSRGGLGLHLAFGIIIAFVFFGMNTFSAVFSTNADLDPFIAAWLPNCIFSVVAVWLYWKAPK